MIRERIGWNEYLRPFLYKELPGAGWPATLGTLCALLFGVMAVSGLILAMYYNPSPDRAYQSIDYIMRDLPMGAVLRGIHHWGAGAMVLAVFLHMLANFFAGSFRAPREFTWIGGVCLLLVTLGLGFTGYLLPWDMKAYWATVVSSNIPRDVPVIGEFVTRLIRGGDTVSGATLTRFYAIHMLLLPALLAVFTVAHIYLVRIHGLSEPRPSGSGIYRFYPEHLLRGALVFGGVLLAIFALALSSPPPREAIAGTLVDSYLPRPEWYFMWLFQLLTYFPGKWEAVGSLAVPILGVALLFAVPFLARVKPVAMAAGVTFVTAVVYLSLTGFEGARSYGQTVLVPGRPLTATESRGLRLYADRECAYCHQIRGQGGHRTGPDLANLVAKRRTHDYLVRYIKNPQAVSATSIMPKYNLPESDLRALADFLLALDFKILKREEVPKL